MTIEGKRLIIDTFRERGPERHRDRSQVRITNLACDTTERDVRALFKLQLPEVELGSIQFSRRRNGKCASAFVEVANDQMVKAAVEVLHGRIVVGRTFSAKRVVPRGMLEGRSRSPSPGSSHPSRRSPGNPKRGYEVAESTSTRWGESEQQLGLSSMAVRPQKRDRSESRSPDRGGESGISTWEGSRRNWQKWSKGVVQESAMEEQGESGALCVRSSRSELTPFRTCIGSSTTPSTIPALPTPSPSLSNQPQTSTLSLKPAIDLARLNSLNLSSSDISTISLISQPILHPPTPSFSRTINFSTSFGYLPPSQARRALEQPFPFADDERMQILYEAFLRAQWGGGK